jgi:hypothetical protein
MRIDPEAHYSPQDLQIGLRIGQDAQQVERESGRLKYSSVGGPNSETIVMKGKDIIDWLARSGQTS